jgi:hypothetical protein
MGIELKQVIPWGRSFDEYRRMFDLSSADLSGRILGCADGPASFNWEATLQKIRVVSCDPIYAFDAQAIEQRVVECHDDLVAQVRQQQDGFVWGEFRDPDEMGRRRLEVMRRFLADFGAGKAQDRYITASLPTLPFGIGSFDLALVSHFLLLYSAHFDLDFHWESIIELLRVAKEVRIFPLLTLARRRSPYVEPLIDRLISVGWSAEIRKAPYEFQRGGNEMLVVRGGALNRIAPCYGDTT